MGVKDIGLKSAKAAGSGVFGTSVITAVSHWSGTTTDCSEQL